MLLAHLPPDSALAREINGDWTVEHELLAASADIANLHRWQHQVVNFKGAPNTPPQPIPRPHRPRHVRRRRHMTVEEMSRTFGLPLRADWRKEGPRDGD